MRSEFRWGRGHAVRVPGERAGDARVKEWFRSFGSCIENWEGLVSALKEYFLPQEAEDNLWEEIRSRKQEPTEKVMLFIAVLEGLFRRLTHPASMETKIKIIKKNLLPFYHPHLALLDLPSVVQLCAVCRRLEATMPRKEPEVVTNVAALGSAVSSAIICWNYRNTGHMSRSCPEGKRRFCYGCGTPGVIRSACAACSGNGSGGRARAITSPGGPSLGPQ